MKTLNLTIIGIVVGVVTVFSVGNFHNIAAECANINYVITPCSGMGFKVSIDKIVYENSERPLISVSGFPGTILGLIVLDAAEHQKFSDTITIGPNGTIAYPLNVTSYQYGIYRAILSDSMGGRVILNFPVALQSSGQIRFNTENDHYNAGDTIILSGSTTPSKDVQILLIDPNLITQYNGTAHSGSTGHFIFKLSLPQFVKSGFWRVRATSETGYMILPVPVGRTEDATDFTSTPPYTYKPGTPLQQIRAGIQAYDVLCNAELQPMIDRGNGLPACVRPQTAQVLSARGWMEIFHSHIWDVGAAADLSAFKMHFSQDKNTAIQGQAIGIDISLNNTSEIPLKVMTKDARPFHDLSLGEQCGRGPMGIAVLRGYYTEENMSQGSALSVFPQFAVSCPAMLSEFSTTAYVFEPASSFAYESTWCNNDNEICGPGPLNFAKHLEINGTWDEGKSHAFEAGVYTLIGGDEWGHLAIKHFTVVNSPSRGNQTN